MEVSEKPEVKGEAFAGESIRERLLAALRHELLGPGSADEVLSQPPGTRYLVGMLAPRGTEVDPSEDESIDAQPDEGGSEEESARVSASLDPSSIGISCVVEEGVERIEIVASWGEYEKLEQAEPEPEESAKSRRGREQWRRTPVSAAVTIPTGPTTKSMKEELAEGVLLEWTSREIGDVHVLSIFLLNANVAPDGKRPPDDLWLYQPQLRVKGDGARFLPRARPREHADPDPDVASADLIYRDRQEFATGHGVAAGWTLTADGTRASEVWTEVVPSSVVPIVEPRGSEGLPAMSMDALAGCDSKGVDALIAPLLAAYEEWIGEQEKDAATLSKVDAVVAEEHFTLCRKALERMRAGLQLLVEDADALASFRFANAAMAEQRRRTVRVRRARRNEPAEADVAAEWRPFQIGFVLLCLPGIVDPASEDRSVADLLWFPTGGGKTEAYLGLTAFTFAHRRLQNGERVRHLVRHRCPDALHAAPVDDPAVRTGADAALRLRAAAGRRPGAVGGGKRSRSASGWADRRPRTATTTPRRHWKNTAGAVRCTSGSPYQILYCPWCGRRHRGRSTTSSDDDLERTLVKCSNQQCDFAASRSELGLPVVARRRGDLPAARHRW